MRLRTELGFSQTLPAGPEYFELFGNGAQLLILGVGPEPEIAKGLARTPDTPVYFMECPELAEKINIPKTWERVISLPRWLRAHGRDARIALYRPGIRFFPSFYGPLAAMVRSWNAVPGPALKSGTIILPGDKKSLLIPELNRAFQAEGRAVLNPDKELTGKLLPKILADETPALFLSVNFQGLDAFGENFYRLRHAGVPVAVWCVDNPWHLTSALRSPFWKECRLFVTDPSFIPGLKEHGARDVTALPLAACPDFFRDPPRYGNPDLKPIVFIGRTAFPDKERFFSGMRLTADQRAAIPDLLEQGARPDFHYWKARILPEKNAALWPGKEVRKAGYLAEESSSAWRKLCVRAAAEIGVSVFGDRGWSGVVPDQDLRPPVDYYTGTPGIYNAARYSLSTTSMLLPHGLNQRHFDVWLAGGFLLSDNTPGLGFFPPELSNEIRFLKARDIPRLVERLEKNPRLRADLMDAWKKEILKAHTYTCRARTILERCGI